MIERLYRDLEKELLGKSSWNIILRVILTFLVLILLVLACGIIIVPLILLLCCTELYYYVVRLKNSVSKKTVFKIMDEHAADLVKKNTAYTLKHFEKDREETLEVFIHDFIKVYRQRHATVNRSNSIICGTRRRRSLGDIFLICRGYYPSCTVAQVLKILINLIKNEKISGSYCCTINKFVFHDDFEFTDPDAKVEYSDKILFRHLLKAYK